MKRREPKKSKGVETYKLAPNTAVNRDAQTAGFAACLAARYLRRWASNWLSLQRLRNISMAFSSAILLFCALFMFPPTCLSQMMCSIKVFQEQKEVLPNESSRIPTFILKPAEFQLEVSPSACSPTIASIPNTEIARQIAEKPIIYSERWAYAAVARPEDSDKLLWWARTSFPPEFRNPPSPDTFAGKQYLTLCEELKFCPNPYPIYSSGHPFSNSLTGSKAEASFKRLDESKSLADAKGKSLLSVIYTLWRSLPSEYPMADPRALLFRANFIYLKFSEE